MLMQAFPRDSAMEKWFSTDLYGVLDTHISGLFGVALTQAEVLRFFLCLRAFCCSSHASVVLLFQGISKVLLHQMNANAFILSSIMVLGLTLTTTRQKEESVNCTLVC